MDNPFFVLTSDEGEIVAIIRHLRNSRKDYENFSSRVKQAIEQHYDCEAKDLTVPDDFHDWSKPIPFTANLDTEGNDHHWPLFSFKLTAAWDY